MIAGALALVFLATLTVISCNSIGDFGKIHEGRIVYSIEYPKDKEQSSLVTLLPETMELKFKEDNTVININGFFAIFSLIYISDHNTHTNYSLLRVMNQKKMYKADTMEIPFGYEKMHNIQIKHTDDTLRLQMQKGTCLLSRGKRQALRTILYQRNRNPKPEHQQPI